MWKGQWGLLSFMKASVLNSAVLAFDAVTILGTFENSNNENRKVKKKEKRKRMILCSVKVPHTYIYMGHFNSVLHMVLTVFKKL